MPVTDSLPGSPRSLNPALLRTYPENHFGGFSRHDGTLQFCNRVQALLLQVGAGVVFDVGCGRGCRVDDPSSYRRAMQDLRGPGRTVIGVDLDPNAASNPYIDEFRLLELNRPWPAEDESVALIYCDYVLEHVEKPGAFFDEVARVLRPGGIACFRTPNRRGYIALASRLVPYRRHFGVLASANRYGVRNQARDVFPTMYRCNTPGKIRAALRERGLDAAVWTVEAEPSYFDFSALAYRIAAFVHEWTPGPFRNGVLAFARKPPAGVEQ